MLINQCLLLFHSCIKHLALESQLSFLQESCFLWHLYKLKRDGNSWKNTYKKFVRIMQLAWVLFLQDSFLMLKRFVSNLLWICRGKEGGELAISLDMSADYFFNSPLDNTQIFAACYSEEKNKKVKQKPAYRTFQDVTYVGILVRHFNRFVDDSAHDYFLNFRFTLL